MCVCSWKCRCWKDWKVRVDDNGWILHVKIVSLMPACWDWVWNSSFNDEPFSLLDHYSDFRSIDAAYIFQTTNKEMCYQQII